MKKTTEQSFSNRSLLRLFTLICTTLVSTLSFGQAGNAPMASPPQFTGPMAIDGFTRRQSAAAGDWFAGPGLTNNIVFTDNCVPLVPLAYHLVDLFNDQINDDIFDGGNKLFQDPNDWGWRSQKPPAKDDINNALVFIALNPVDQHIWVAIAGDRMSTNGTSYLDFEFYQNPITKTGGPIPGGTGGFQSDGPHGGRTVGDLSITLEYTQGGSFASVSYLQWQPGSEAGTYDYLPLNPPAGTAFAAANGGATPIDFPCGAFGSNQYTTLQFVEGAIDLTALIGGTGPFGECSSLPFKSLFIKSKSSAERTADLKDFISPLQINVCFDKTAPVISCPNTINLGCNPTVPGPSGATASDNCDGPVVPVASDGPIQSTGCNRSMNRIWIAMDDCGNMSSCTQVINWIQDNSGPALTTGGTTTTLGCNPSAGDINAALGTASASDACSTPTISQSDGSVTSNGCSRSQTRSWSSRDACGNTSSAARTVTWTSDVTAPSITANGTTTTLGCNPSANDIGNALGSASATDACGPTTVTQSDGPVGSNGCGRSQTRTFTARDGCGITATTSRTVTWTADNTGPVITTGGTTTTLGCNPSANDIGNALGTATATDACGTPTLSSSDGNVSSNGCSRSQTRTWTAIDACGNTSTASRTVTWTADATPPVLTTGGGSLNLGCNPSANDIGNSLGTATATDACGPTTISQSDGNVTSDGCSRSQTRTFTARDGCGNTATASRTVTWTADVTPPVLTTGGGSLTLGCNPSANDIGNSLGTATATDACGTPTVTQSDGTIASNGCGRSQTRTFTARDACGNTATASRTVTWTADVTPPTLTTGGGSLSLGCNPSANDIGNSLGTATATDACGTPTVTQSDGNVTSDGCSRSQTRTFTARDACGNTSTASRTVTWTADVTPPSFTGSYTTVPLGCNPTGDQISGALDGATATDACGPVTISQSDGSLSSDGCSRSQTRTFTARDGCGNTATVSRTVTWTADVTPPAFTGSYSNVALGCNPAATDITAALDGSTATDACGPVTITQSDAAVQSTGCSRSQTRTFTARDGCGNTATISRTVTWTSDVTPPVLTTGGTSTSLGCNPSANDIGLALGTASATDACGPTTISSSDGSVTSDGCSRSQTRTWTARDGCGNTATASRTVTWTADVTPPVLTTGGGSLTLGCNPSAGDINGSLGTATATDACGVPTVSSSDGNVTSDGCSRSQTRTFTARDACGNTATASRTVTWTADVTPPTLTTGGGSLTLGCNPSANDIGNSLGTATATDACGVPTVTQSDGTVASNGCGRSQTRTFTARDACGNTATASRTVTWTADVTPPTLTTGGGSLTLGCNPSANDIGNSLGTATATDACGTPTVTQSDGNVTSDGCSRSQTRTFTARDACGNTSTASRTVTWTADVTPPTLTTGGGSLTLGCNPSAGDINGSLGTATATDACGSPTVSSSDGNVTSDGCSRSQTRTFTARDACGNTSTASRTVTWIADVTPPVLTTGGTGTSLGCNPSAGDINSALGTATATDACGVPTVSSSDGNVTSDGCSRSQTRTFTARDFCGNTSTASRTVTWTADVTPPTLTTGGGSLTLGCNPSAGDINSSLGTATATDACGTPTVSSSDGSVSSNGCNRSQTRTFTARDFCGNTSTASRTVTWVVDLTPPVLTTGGTSTNLGCNPSAGDINNALGTATATDGCGTPTVSSSDGNVTSEGCNRSQTRTWTARDFCGNTSTASRTVTWVVDLTPPVLTTGGTSTNLGCNPSAGDINNALGTATATDGCGTPTVSSSDGNVTSDGCNRSQTRTWTARDFCGNTSTASRTVTWVVDLTPPVLTTGGTTTNLGCNPSAGDINNALGTATATDGCGTPTVSSSDGSVSSNGCNRSQTRTWTARDFCGNTSTASRTVTWVVDLTPPVLTTGGTSTNLGCNPSAGDINNALGTATATDGCGTPTVSSSDGSVSSNGCNRSQTRTWTARDFCGNTSTASRTVTWVVDLTPPVLTTGGTTTNLGCNPSAGDINNALGTATATDGCGTPTVSSSDGNVTSDGCNRSQTRTWTARDFCGNTSTASRTVTWVVDLTPPVLTTGGTTTNLGCNPSAGDINNALGTATATDGCGTPTVSSSDGSVSSNGCNRSQTRTWTARDFCGNTSTASRTVTWTADVTPPVLTTGGGSLTLGCNPSAGDINSSLGTASATDACGTPTVTQSDGSVTSNGCSRSQTRTFTARDFCGNTSTASRTVTWTADVTPPVFTSTPASVDIECYEEIPALVNPTASDACSTPTVGSAVVTDNNFECTVSNNFKRIVTRKWTARDGCGNTATYTQTIRVKCCEAICTYTQGAYGNAGGQDCDGTSNMSTTALINQSIANAGGLITIGKAGHSVTIATGQASCVIAALPGGGPAKELPASNSSICNLPGSLVNGQGRIKNVLLAQTITLALNINITSPSDLGVFPLQGGVLATADPVGGCGSDIPEQRICHYSTTAPYGLTSVENEYTYRTISAAVVNAIPGTKNVAGLLELANRALADVDGVNGSENGVSLSAISNAVAAINEVFDECKIFVGWNVAPCPATDPAHARIAVSPASPTLAVTAFPNPYEENFSLRINSPVSGQALIGFYTIDGVKIGEMKRDVTAHRDISIPYNVPAVYRTRIVYTVTVGEYNAKGVVLSPNEP